MASYEPGCTTQGTCPYCEQRVKVGRPVATETGRMTRRCGKHKLPQRDQIGRAGPYCPGHGLTCLEDRPRG